MLQVHHRTGQESGFVPRRLEERGQELRVESPIEVVDVLGGVARQAGQPVRNLDEFRAERRFFLRLCACSSVVVTADDELFDALVAREHLVASMSLGRGGVGRLDAVHLLAHVLFGQRNAL
jgi:hypothetical protein